MESLIALGFSGIEAAIYVHLLENSPATGYQIAKGIEKPNANTYQALDSMVQQGFLLVDGGQVKDRLLDVPDRLSYNNEEDLPGRLNLYAVNAPFRESRP